MIGKIINIKQDNDYFLLTINFGRYNLKNKLSKKQILFYKKNNLIDKLKIGNDYDFIKIEKIKDNNKRIVLLKLIKEVR